MSMSFARSKPWLLANKVSTGKRRELWIADVPDQVGVGELLCLDHHVESLRAVESPILQRVLLHDVQHHQRGNAIAVRRQLADSPAAVCRADWRYPFRLKLRQVGSGKGSADLLRELQDRLCRGAFVETITALRGNQLSDFARSGLRKTSLTFGARPSIRKVFAAARLLRQLVDRSAPTVADDFSDRESVFGVINGGGENFGKRLCSEFRREERPIRRRRRAR